LVAGITRQRQRVNKRITATTTELSKEYRRRIRLLESVKKVNGRQKYRKITKVYFGSIVMSIKK
jgi:hypothetical protein